MAASVSMMIIGVLLAYPLLFASVRGQCSAISSGGYITQSVTINSYDSPCQIQEDVIVGAKATLTLNAGTQLQFAPGVMLAINGTLLAKGAPNNRVVLTKIPSNDDVDPVWPSDIRLVDDFSVSIGRLQIFYRNKWRGICANAVNWTQSDVNVTCQQLGFQTGNFSFVAYANNDSSYILYYEPSCVGNEQNILDCPGGKNIQIGSRICQTQQTINLNCTGLSNSSAAQDYWWGLEFYNTTTYPSINGIQLINESTSILQNVDILYAGVTSDPFLVPAIRASPSVPALVNVTIRNCALDGTNFTMVMSSTIVYNSLFINNRGHGLAVETILGHVVIRDSVMTGNHGDGIKAKFLDHRFVIVDDMMTFCNIPNLQKQSFPQLMSGIPTIGNSCGRLFQSQYGQQLTFNVLEMNIEPDAWGTLDVYDGQDMSAPKLASYTIINGTLPMGIMSTFYYMFIKFSWRKPNHVCPTLLDCVKFTILVDSAVGSTPEYLMHNTTVSNNTQFGVYLENARNYIIVNSSNIVNNGYGAGVRVYGGAGDILINASHVDFNQDNGVNITYDGGYRIFNLSSFSYNNGNGVNITFNATSVDNQTRYTRQQKTEVSRSHFVLNQGYGILVANYCQSGRAVVNDSTFISNQQAAVVFYSCFKIIPDQNVTNFTVGYNVFQNNSQQAIRITPVINVVGRIANNTFTGHSRYVLLLDNTDDFLHNQFFQNMSVGYEVMGNTFVANDGYYVANVRLTTGSQRQQMLFMYNVFQDNMISSNSPTLNERTRAYAVIILSSDNIVFNRNALDDPMSDYEIATYLADMSVTLNATMQWWGTTNYSYVIMKIFDQYSRYNLARIAYHPALAQSWLWTPVLTILQIALEVPFMRGNWLGGRLATQLNLAPGRTYYADRDMSVLNLGLLYVTANTEIQFANGLGLLVEGYANFVGTAANPIVLTLSNDSTWINSTVVRVADGPNEMEGRLEVRPTENDDWGTICDNGWTMQDAAVACGQMGFVVHPALWLVYDNIPGSDSQIIYRSNVQCTNLDTDIMECMGDDQNDNSCNHTSDVYLKCTLPTWAGMRFLATAVPSLLSYVTITQAGLMDPSTVAYAPAIKIDYNVHSLNNLLIADNMNDGLQVMKNDVYGNVQLASSVVRNNMGNGVSIRTSFFDVYNCSLVGNNRSGFDYNPTYTTQEALQIRAGIRTAFLFDHNDTIQLGNENYRFVITPQTYDVEVNTYFLQINVNSLYKVVIDIVDYNPLTSEEQVTVYDSAFASIRPTSTRWSIEQDLPDFPVVSQLTNMTVRWTVTGVSSGRFAFVVRSKAWDWPWPFGVTSVRNTTIMGNYQGAFTHHYNQPSNEFLDLFFRYRWETIRWYGVSFVANQFEAIYAESITKFNLLYVPSYVILQQTLKVAEITYDIDSCLIEQNGLGVVMEHLAVEFSNNVWIWQLTNDVFQFNKEGGFDIELPKINLLDTILYNHSLQMNGTTFYNNSNFAFIVDGFYCNSTITGNRFQGNQCQVGCFELSGTEKDFDMNNNEFVENSGRYIVQFYMTSHTPFTTWVQSSVTNNIIKRNQKPAAGSLKCSPSEPNTYALGVRGLQNMTINRNSFANPAMDLELLGGQVSSLLENYLDVTENWWGTVDQVQITSRIFDFDDWNSFAIAEYFPFLAADSFSAQLFTGTKYVPVFDLTQPIGGRVIENLHLYQRSAPYVVSRDLTVMDDVSLTIDPGVEIQFYPSVGILVLGSLVADGSPNSRIRFSPVVAPICYANAALPDNIEKIQHPDIDPNLGYQVRLAGGTDPNEGFIEIYNKTERRWTIICDDSFSDMTAEVACRTMNKESSNAIVRRNAYWDIFVLGYPMMHNQVIEWFWRETLICDGSESDFTQCGYQINYNLYQCMQARHYVVVRCGPRNLPADYDYWGSVRFSSPTYEYGQITPGYSSLSYTDFYGAGILHEEKSAAVQSMYRLPESDSVRIMDCASNGYDYVAPMDQFYVQNNVIQNNNGYAISVLVLNGQTSDVPNSLFVPLVPCGIPYDVYGTIRMCTTEKMVYVVDRALIYHKYDYNMIDCIKIVRSQTPRKQIGIRFLQVNLYNDTLYENAISMYNSEYVDTAFFIGKISVNSSQSDIATIYTTSVYYDTMSIRVTTSQASGDFGFIAEIVTLPLSPIWRPDYGPGSVQLIVNNSMTNNEGGGFLFQNVGESNIRVTFSSNFIQNCGLAIFNNTNPGVVNVFIQNTQLMTISNNFVGYNAGGISVNTTTRDNSVALYANITNNIIMYNTHCEPLHTEGSQFQGFDVRYNYIAFNNVDYRNIFGAFGVQLNFTSNIVYNNTGQCIMNASVPELITINQQYVNNAIYFNWASSYNRSTFFLKSAKFLITNNYFLNPYNLYDIVMYNRTKYPDGTYPLVQAQNNWWGGGSLSYVAGRVWDRLDDDNLIGVQYQPFYLTNASVLQGKCFPGWRLFDEKCYWYFGGVTTYAQAESICKMASARLAWARSPNGQELSLGELVMQFQFNYDVNWQTWIYNDWQISQKCTVLRNYIVDHAPCNALLPFICEKDPFISPVLNIIPIVLAAAITGGILLCVVCPLTIFAMLKSCQRKEEKVERRETLRRSLRSSRRSTLAPQMTATSSNFARPSPFSEADLVRRQRPPMHALENKFLDLSGVTLEDSSTESVFKAKVDFHHPSTPASSNLSKADLTSSYHDSDLGPIHRSRGDHPASKPHRLENEIPSTSVRVPDYDVVGRGNRGYVDDSFYTTISDSSCVEPAHWTGGKSVPRPSREPGGGRDLRPMATLSSLSPPDSGGYRASGESGANNSGSSGLRNGRPKPPRPKPNESAI